MTALKKSFFIEFLRKLLNTFQTHIWMAVRRWSVGIRPKSSPF